MAIERIVPGTLEWDAYYQNHISRYHFAAEYLLNKQINNLLDAACGVGYGSAYLSDNLPPTKIIAVDRSDEALTIAKKHFKRDKIIFLEDDCHTLLAANAYAPFDAIVSFETLEHLPKPDAFLKSCYTNLNKGGELIISTPNNLHPDFNGKAWEFHEKEYTPEELIELVRNAGFSSIQVFGQRYTELGILRQQMRAELNTILSNPFIRMGQWFQKAFRGRNFSAILPEQKEDIEITPYSREINLKKNARDLPFVLIAIGIK